DNPLALPPVGSYQLRILSSNLLELTRITTKPPSAKPTAWDFVDANGRVHLPGISEFLVSAGDVGISVKSIGFKRRVIYAPLAQRDLRIGNYFYLLLGGVITNGQNVQVKNTSGKLWPSQMNFSATMEPLRYSPAIHVNEVGYVPATPKKAMV